jgi:hypothetical protein
MLFVWWSDPSSRRIGPCLYSLSVLTDVKRRLSRITGACAMRYFGDGLAQFAIAESRGETSMELGVAIGKSTCLWILFPFSYQSLFTVSVVAAEARLR